ncbi:hypothetical protein E9993_06940 [Labilibacter sediminis]|nr:hypothetical protein E9993_06940 [Labilibacter sediminis]
MRSVPVLLVFLLIGLFFYFGINKFELPKSFLFQKTLETKGIVKQVKLTRGIKGYMYEQVTYEYQVNDSVYIDIFKAGQREGHQFVGDHLLIKYSVKKPGKNEVIGFYRDSELRKKKQIKTSNKTN